MIRWACGLVLFLAVACAPQAEPPPADRGRFPDAVPPTVSPEASFTLEQVRDIRARFDPTFTEWSSGGDLSRYVYLHMSEFWPQIVLRRSRSVRSLPVDSVRWLGDATVRVDAGEMSLAGYVASSPVDGAIVLHEGRVLFEAYPRMSPRDRHIWFSVSKTVVSTALAILEDRGRLDVTRPVDAYLPALKGTEWEEIPVIDILDMASGIDCPEVHPDPDSCFWEFYHAFGWPKTDPAGPGPMHRVTGMGRAVPSGTVFDYTSVNTEVLNWLVEAVSGTRFSDFVEREIWTHIGAESDAFITATSRGESFSAGGVSSTLRDLARYGLLFTPLGRTVPDPVVSEAHLERIREGGRARLTTEEQRNRIRGWLRDTSFRHSTRQWDVVTTDGDFYKGGFGGQGLYISPSRDLVVAWFGTGPASGGLPPNEMLKIARQLVASGLFDEE
jgi:CubicO group peptidase (beta-lactamase class C family)